MPYTTQMLGANSSQVVLLWAIPTPRTIMPIIPAWESPHLAIVNHEDCHFQFQIVNWDAQVINVQGEDHSTLLMIAHALPIVHTIDSKTVFITQIPSSL